jgi:hypothetical protein
MQAFGVSRQIVHAAASEPRASTRGAREGELRKQIAEFDRELDGYREVVKSEPVSRPRAGSTSTCPVGGLVVAWRFSPRDGAPGLGASARWT